MGFSQVLLSADGPGNTYSLINSVLAPGYNVIEAPDCSHPAFGEHIDEVFDSELNSYVFRFSIHVSPDDDRCINFDRQRNEIKTYDKSPDHTLGVENETVQYRWKFKLPVGFQSSPKFTHLHQLKSVGDPYDSMPMYTLTARKGNPDRLELRYAEFGNQVTLAQTALAPLMGTWVIATETIEYTNPGSYTLTLIKVSDNSILFSYSNDSIANWRVGADFLRPKWGIYRSLVHADDLRDEEVLYADFGIEENPILSNGESSMEFNFLRVSPNPVNNVLEISGMPPGVEKIGLYNAQGKVMVEYPVKGSSRLELDVSAFPQGIYVLRIIGRKGSYSQLIFIYS